MISRIFAVIAASATLWTSPLSAELPIEKGDKIVLVGNTLAERMQHFNHWETLLHSRFPQHELVVRNLGWSADEPFLQPRSKDFDDHGHTLDAHKPNVIIAFWGYSESFAGPSGVRAFEERLGKWIEEVRSKDWGEGNPELALVSPIAAEQFTPAEFGRNSSIRDFGPVNKNLKIYTDAIGNVAKKYDVTFVDAFGASQKLYQGARENLTINGIHLDDEGYSQLAPAIDIALFGSRARAGESVDLDILHSEITEKNLQHWYDYRAVNGYYIYGGRKKPFGVVNFPSEFVKLRNMIAKRDARIWAAAQGKELPAEIDDSGTGEFAKVESNVKEKIVLTSPEESKARTFVPEGFELTLFASEQEWPELENPCQLSFDAEGRLWVCTMESYPMYLPGQLPDDKILIFEDTDGDGKADKQTVFADGLHLPTGFEVGDGGCYVGQQPNLVYLGDTDGDDKADVREIVLHGFDSADSHHSISAFEWGPGGDFYMQEGTFHHSQVEGPFGPTRVKDAAVFRWEPTSGRFSTFISYKFANPWGHCFDEYGQNYIADASNGFNYFASAFSGDVDYGYKHPKMLTILQKQWRPTSGCEIVSSRNFPDEMQGDFLLNNCIGFHGTLQYRFVEDSTVGEADLSTTGTVDNGRPQGLKQAPPTLSGRRANPVEPLVRSDDSNFRPVDCQFGPDGALYIVDWFNPLVGHMQHSVRDPNRDNSHGRIWRVHYTKKPLITPPKIAGESIDNLLELLKEPELRTRYRVRTELRRHPREAVAAATKKWAAGLTGDDAERLKLEALWVLQHHDMVDEEFLTQLLNANDFRVRAAATRVLCYTHHKVADVLDLLAKQARDEEPRVRLEAVRALSFFHEPADIERALAATAAVLEQTLDYYIEYTLNETLNVLEARAGGSSASGESPLVTMFKQSGDKDAAQRLSLARLIGQRGGSKELNTLLDATVTAGPRDPAAAGLVGVIAYAVKLRKIELKSDVSGLAPFLSSGPADVRSAAVTLATALKAKSLAEPLVTLVADAKAPTQLRDDALAALVRIDKQAARKAISAMTGKDQPADVRMRGVIALVPLNTEKAAATAADVLASLPANASVAEMTGAFLGRQDGAEVLSKALASASINEDVAKKVLRYSLSIGRNEPALVKVLEEKAGLTGDARELTKEEVLALAEVVRQTGDPVHGEEVFRRAELNCFKCHAVNKAGGQIGPELTAVGVSSPVDYVINSLLYPSQAIKEAWQTKVILTADGLVVQGIEVAEDDEKLTLRDANGKIIEIPIDDIDFEEKGKSLMPSGLTKYLTDQEFVDLVAYLKALGTPDSPYAVRSTPRIQKWASLQRVGGNIADYPAGDDKWRRVRDGQYTTLYAMANGDVPLDEALAVAGGPTVYLKAMIDVEGEGPVNVKVGSSDGTYLYIDGKSREASETMTVDLTPGRHVVVLRVDSRKTDAKTTSLEFVSTGDVKVTVVDGE